VADERNLEIRWQPISLLFKNDPPEGSESRTYTEITHGHLRIMESVRDAADSPEAANHDIGRLYWELGSRIHHDGALDIDPVEVLETLGLDTSHAAAATDPKWDEAIRTRMDEGLALVGDDVGTPIIATERSDGTRVGYFGPVITKIPRGEMALKLWDGLDAMLETDGFFELKKTRSEMPDFGERPEPLAAPKGR